MTEGQRIARETLKAHLHEQTADGPIFDQGVVDDLGQQIDAAIAAAREEKDKAWLDEIASHDGWASDVILIRCMAHREHRELNLNAAGPSECGWCAYLRGRDG